MICLCFALAQEVNSNRVMPLWWSKLLLSLTLVLWLFSVIFLQGDLLKHVFVLHSYFCFLLPVKFFSMALKTKLSNFQRIVRELHVHLPSANCILVNGTADTAQGNINLTARIFAGVCGNFFPWDIAWLQTREASARADVYPRDDSRLFQEQGKILFLLDLTQIDFFFLSLVIIIFPYPAFFPYKKALPIDGIYTM